MVHAKVAQGWVFKILSLHPSDGINQDKQSNHVLKDEVNVHVKANNLQMQRDP
jgi:hypothetical protein